ncbi:MAG: cytochrome b/b6 domain-containing protein [Gammaproteobacteria bacterium]
MKDKNDLIAYKAWDLSTRIFHWLNVICVTGLMAVGTVILNYKLLGIDTDGKILLKTIHVTIGYVFVINLAWRMVWGFIGGRYSRWKMILPFGKDYLPSLREYIIGVKSGKPPAYLGHNPVARLMVALLFLLLTTQAITGLTLAGTDVYMPPFGNQIIEYIAAVDENQNRLGEIRAGYKDNIDEQAYQRMRAYRKPVNTIHYTVFFILLTAIILHILGVIFTEVKEKNTIISAMITGKKYFNSKPVDIDVESTKS